jgi:hypothetical protein
MKRPPSIVRIRALRNVLLSYVMAATSLKVAVAPTLGMGGSCKRRLAGSSFDVTIFCDGWDDEVMDS